MLTLKSNIAFLTHFNEWRRDVSDAQHMPMPSPAEIGLHLDFAIQSLAMLEQMVLDVTTGKLIRNDDWDEKP